MASNLVFDFRHHYVVGERRASEPSAYQFDQGHLAEIYVPENATSWEVHYAFGDFPLSEGYNVDDVEAADDGGYVITAHVPNDLFERSGELRVYLMAVEEESIITTYEGYVFIKNRNQPDDYVDDDPDNHATHLLEEAEAAAATAVEKAAETEAIATLSESYAKGGTGTRTGEDTDNAKYYMERAATLSNADLVYNVYPTETAQGNPASFDDGADNIPVKDLKVSIVPHQEGSGDPSPDNVRPITGMTEVEVERTGFNQWDEQWEVGNISAVDGSTVSGDNTIRTKNYILVSPSTSYFIKSSNSGIYAVFMYAADKAYIGSEEYSNITNHVLTTPSNCRYLKFRNYAGYGVVYKNDISINLPSTDTDYHAYQGQTVTTDLGRTVYGGVLDVTTGVLTVDMASVDLGTLTWSINTANRFMSTNEMPNVLINSDFVTPRNALCSMYQWVRGDNLYSGNDPGFSYYIEGGQNRLYVKNLAYTDAATFKTAMSGVQLVYELATPQTYQLTPQELLSVLGTNHISTDAESVDVEYRADIKLYIEQLTKPSEDDLIANQAIEAGKFFMIGNRLFLSTASIANGANITVGTNATELSLSDALNNLNS